MYFRILNHEASGELTYLLADQDAREAVLIDPHGRDLPLLAALSTFKMAMCSHLVMSWCGCCSRLVIRLRDAAGVQSAR